jgi:hypothetical protein
MKEMKNTLKYGLVAFGLLSAGSAFAADGGLFTFHCMPHPAYWEYPAVVCDAATEAQVQADKQKSLTYRTQRRD